MSESMRFAVDSDSEPVHGMGLPGAVAIASTPHSVCILVIAKSNVMVI